MCNLEYPVVDCAKKKISKYIEEETVFFINKKNFIYFV